MMKLLTFLIAATCLAWTLNSCSSSTDSTATFCDTACISDTIRFTKNDHSLKPFVKISPANCVADSLIWGNDDMGSRKLAMSSLFGSTMKLNKDAMDVYIRDTSYAWVVFNNCVTGRGFLAKIPYNTREAISTKTSAINRFDKKFDIDKNLIAYSDRGNLFVEEPLTGKQAMMTFGERVEIDYDKMHDFIDTVKVTPTSIYAKVKIKGQWVERRATIQLK